MRLFVGLCFLSVWASAAIYQHHYSFQSQWDTVGWAGEWYEVPGYPKVPVVYARILLPYGEHFRTAQGKSVLQESYDTELLPEVLSFPKAICSAPKNRLRGWDRQSQFPLQSIGEPRVLLKHGFEMVTIPLFVEQFDPSLRRHTVYKETMLEIETDMEREDHGYRGLLEDMVEVASLVDNPDVLITYPERDRYRSAKYLAIGPQAIIDDLDPTGISALLSEKENRGITTAKVSLEKISSTFAGSDIQEKVRNAIKAYYKDEGTKFVLLIGNGYSILPARQLKVAVADERVASDFYYACLDGSFASNSTADLACEVWVGRAPVSNVMEMRTFVTKTLKRQAMDSLDPTIENNLLFGEKLDSQTLGSKLIEQLALGGKAGSIATMGYPESANHSRLYETFSSSFTASQVIDAINKGNFYTVNHMGHASQDYCMRFNSNSIPQLKNAVPFFGITQGCHPGDLNGANWASKLVLHSKGGAAAMVANSGYGWYNSNGSEDGPSNRYHLTFYDTLFRERKQSLGLVHYRTKERLIPQIQSSEYIRSVVYETNLLGDPELKFKFLMPL